MGAGRGDAAAAGEADLHPAARRGRAALALRDQPQGHRGRRHRHEGPRQEDCRLLRRRHHQHLQVKRARALLQDAPVVRRRRRRRRRRRS
eukprot:1155340-Rhodomonas_salina.1